MAATTTTTLATSYLAAEVLVQLIGAEASQNSIMPQLMWVENLEGDESMSAHFRNINPLPVPGTVTEGAGLPVVAWSPTGVVITAGMDGQAVQASKVLTTISPRVLSDIALSSGRAIGRAIDTAACALFSSFTGGTVGTTGAALTVNNILDANANLDANHADEIGSYYGVLSPHAFNSLLKDVKSSSYGIAKVDVTTGRNVIDIDGTLIYKNTLVPKINTGADYAGGIFVSQALGLAIAKQPTVEVLSIPGYATWTVDSYVAFGVGVLRPDLGCLLVSGVSA